MKMACPGLVRALALTPDSVFCAAGIAEKIYIWEVSHHTLTPSPWVCAGVDRSPASGGGSALPTSVSPDVH